VVRVGFARSVPVSSAGVSFGAFLYDSSRSSSRSRKGLYPALPMPRMEPALPMLKIEPVLPMLRIDPELPMLSTEPTLPMLRMEPALRMLPTLKKLRILPGLRLLSSTAPARRTTPQRATLTGYAFFPKTTSSG
jgi:hypothetical protein